MNIFKKLFGKKVEIEKKAEKIETKIIVSNEDRDKLKLMLEPTIKNATKIILEKLANIDSNSNLKSQFGGEPYFEIGENWPQSKNGVNLSYVFQIYISSEFELPKNIKLIQFFYDFEEMPWSTEDDGWFVKIYEELNPEKITKLNKPNEQENIDYCEIKFEKVKSLPDWEGIDEHNKAVADFISELNNEEPYETYDEIVKELTGQDDYQSQIGGYPKWLQGENTPQNEKGENLKLLIEMDSQDDAGIMWGDSGLLYFFYDEKSKKVEFELQCC
ncbi:DUF1963 domain-containing protein [Flavobacterium psychrophilum]|uniref:DUF1963 domain-containing protein n=2 Tax=Flavobacterium psychrophilum TaxID=96345 RepID=UPI00073F64C8|nr:DUF1963 domain-containing protein [Flavobacterium psychrophilum]GAQ49961.1 hypothetical protein FPK15_contig00077-0002 [Flavobacterium psychrophilum]GAW90611.1 hypothetical protein FPS14_contig00076-0002 [Flavobacterium psychrophilum]GEJ29116.1 hypothetical protein FPN185_contig00032-0001 [Flavobacterium psychrophilum]GEJ29339.1 hypothetical protein FPN182_contig00136-0001 [Flavobacterium psychrophilum]GEJ34178.1 hypothetical protein FPN181_contig00095-0001 [Flavobacterium psychrophilum]